MKIFATIVSGLAGWAVGCSTTTTTTGNAVAGNAIGGVSFEVVDGAAMVRTSRGLTNIVLTDFADTCSIADERARRSSKQLTFLVSDDVSAGSSGTPPSKPGTYTIMFPNVPASGPAAQCGFAVYDATCHPLIPTPCESGTVTLTRVDAQGYAGTFDVMIAGSQVNGSFDVPSCSNGNSESGFGTCQ